MNGLAKRILIGFAGFLLVYLMGSFYNVSFNISNWSDHSRLIISVIVGFAFIMLATYSEY